MTGPRPRRWPSALALAALWPACTPQVAPTPPASGSSETGPACPEGSIQDTDGDCVPEACGTGPWGGAEPGPDTAVRYVLPEGTGEGQADDPMGSIQQALDALDGPGRVVLGAGEYTESLALDRRHDGIELWGRCPEMVLLTGDPGSESGDLVAMHGVDAHAAVHGLTLSGGPGAGAGVTAGHLGLVDIEARGNVIANLSCTGTTASLRVDASWVHDAQSTPEDAGGVGIYLANGCSAEISDTLVSGATGTGIFAAHGGTSARLDGVQIEDVREQGGAGYGLISAHGATVRVTDSGLREIQGVGLVAIGTGASVHATDTTISDVYMGTAGEAIGALVAEGAEMTLESTWVSRSADQGVQAEGDGSHLQLLESTVQDIAWGEGEGVGVFIGLGATAWIEDTTIEQVMGNGIQIIQEGQDADGYGAQIVGGAVRGCVPDQADGGGTGVHVARLAWARVEGTTLSGNGYFGLSVGEGAHVDAAGLSVQDNIAGGVGVAGSGTSLTLHDSAIQGGLPHPSSLVGPGLQVTGGAQATASNLRIGANSTAGAMVDGDGSALHLSSSEISDTKSGGSDRLGSGILVQHGALLVAQDVDVLDSNGMGISAHGSHSADQGQTSLTLDDVRIRNTLPGDDGDGTPTAGGALVLNDGAIVTATGLQIAGSYETGVFAFGLGTGLTMQGGSISEIRSSPDYSAAVGVVAQDHAIVALSEVAIADVDGPGLLVDGGRATLSDGAVAGTGFASIAVRGGSLEAHRVGLQDAAFHPQLGGGTGLWAQHQASAATSLLLTESTLSGHDFAAVWLIGDGDFVVRDNHLVAAGPAEPREGVLVHGDGIVVSEGATPVTTETDTGVLLSGNHIAGAAQAAGVLLHGASATLDGNTWEDNGVDLRQQACRADTEEVGPASAGERTDQICDARGDRLFWSLPFSLEFSPPEVEL